MPVSQTLVEQLKHKRQFLGWSQRELAARSGVPQAQVSRIESGKVDPRLSSLEAISLALGVEPATRPALPPAARNGMSPKLAQQIELLTRAHSAENARLQKRVEAHFAERAMTAQPRPSHRDTAAIQQDPDPK